MINNPRWEKASKLIAINIEDFLKYFKIDFRKNGNRYSFPCPLHYGDNLSGAALYDNKSYITFQCFTNCPATIKKDGISFIKNLLSRPGEVSYEEAIKFVYDFVNESAPAFTEFQKETERDIFLKVFGEETTTSVKTITKELIRARLKIPSMYFLNRGFSGKILDEYDVGNCTDPTRKFYNRAVVPCYDRGGLIYQGATLRSLFEECKKCTYHHDPTKMCPISDYEMWKSEKWLHDNIFPSKMIYNLWGAQEEIKKTHKAIIVEGPADCIKLVSLGIKNVVALYGNYLKQGQSELLDSCGTMDLIVMLDNDPAGIKGSKDIKDKYSRQYRIYYPKYKGKDAGELQTDAETEDIKRILAQIGT